MTWENARRFCARLGAEMVVVVETEQERKEITKMTSTHIARMRRFWLDGRKVGNTWTTHGGSTIPSYTPWGRSRCGRLCGVTGRCLRTGADSYWYRADCGAVASGVPWTKNPLTHNPLCKQALE